MDETGFASIKKVEKAISLILTIVNVLCLEKLIDKIQLTFVSSPAKQGFLRE